jgi:BirA family biotin operon repressor/biotin-[acetyl-CoA-carboxylase] ligase
MLDPPLAAPTPERLRPLLETQWLGRAYQWLDACASTNDRAAEQARAGAPEGLVVAADRQTGGRGRLGRTWHSPAGENLYFSMVLRPARPPSEVPPLTLLAGVAVADSLAALGARPRLKWPNDVLLEASGGGSWRKVAGILTEMATEGDRVGHVVIGIGLNVNGSEFPGELAAIATSLRRVLGRPLDRAALLASVLGALERQCDGFRAAGPSAGVAAWQAYAPAGERCRVRAPLAGQGQEMIEGIALGVDPDGALRVRDDAGRVHRVLSGEIAT